MHLLRLLRGILPGRLDRGDPHPRVPRREARRPDLHQADAARHRRPLRGRDREGPRGRRAIPMTFDEIAFWGFSIILVASALGVITSRNPVHAALLLVLAFCTSAAIW